MKPDFLGQTADEIESTLTAWKEPNYRAGQVLQAIYQRKQLSFDAIHNIPPSLRKKLNENFEIAPLTLLEKIDSEDHSTKFLLRLSDREAVETVFIRTRARRTVCVSVQVGCKFGCRFCASGVAGFRRNLTAGEIVSQVLTVASRCPRETITHIVCMGMGEPLDNAPNLIKALEILTDPRAFGLGRRRVTISTIGLIPMIEKLAQAARPDRMDRADSTKLRRADRRSINRWTAAGSGRPWELSISLHAPNDTLRSSFMPVNRAYPVDRLLKAARRYTEKTKRYITFEYILIAGVNDQKEIARELARKLREIPCKVNLIPYNPIAEYPEKRPSLHAIRAFEGILRSRGIRATVRFSKGRDIDAACGQLRLRQGPGCRGRPLWRPRSELDLQ